MLQEDFISDITEISKHSVVSLDTETTGLNPFRSSRIFAISLSTGVKEYYYDFREIPLEWLGHLNQITKNKDIVKCMHNAQFDMSFFGLYGIEFENVWDTMCMARLECNTHFKYSLEDCGARIGTIKDDQVKKWISDNGAYRVEVDEETGAEVKVPEFHKVPRYILEPYAKQDARVCYSLYEHQRDYFEKEDKKSPGIGAPLVSQVFNNEKLLTIVCSNMTNKGVRVDTKYCEDALQFEISRRKKAEAEFESLTKRRFVDSGKLFSDVLPNFGITAGKTAKGRDSFAAEVLERYRGNAVAESILAYRDANKRGETYFSNYRSLAGHDGRIHATFRQAGTFTGRFSSSNPNLQNVPKKEEDTPFPVRAAFIPSLGNVFVSIDYKQQEYRLMVDYAGEEILIGMIKSGYDVHEATAALTGVTRDVAKIVNFSLLYGSGVTKLAHTLGISIEKARYIKSSYFAVLPRVKKWISETTSSAENRKYVWNWYGRRLQFPLYSFCYRAPNHVIQGGCADIMKVAMTEIHSRGLAEHLVLNVHDELVFDMPKSKLYQVEEIAKIMKEAYPYKSLPMDVSISIGEKNWHVLRDFKDYQAQGSSYLQ